MAEISGRGGQVDAASEVAGIKSWSLDYTLDTLDTTDFSDGGSTNNARTFIPGLSQWSGTFEGFKDGSPLALGFTSSITIKLYESQTASQLWQGSAYITGIHPATAVDGVVSYTYDFQGTNELTEASA